MPKPKQTMKPVKLPLAKKKSSRGPLRRLRLRCKKAEKRNFSKGLSLSTFYQRYYSIKDFDELHAEVGIDELYSKEDDDKDDDEEDDDEEDDDEEDDDEETYLIGKARALLSGPLEPLNSPKKKVVYEEVYDDDEEEDDDEDIPDAFLAPIRKETSKAKKLTKTEAKLLATELLNDCLEPLNRPNDTNWLNIVSILEDIFRELEPAAKDELVHQLCIQLDIDVDYDKNIVMLKRFFADIDRDGECINDNMSRHTFMILSLVYNAYENEWVKAAKATFAESKEIKSLFDEMKRSMPGSTPAEVMKAVNKHIFKNAKASLSNDATITADDDVVMTANDNETPSFQLPNDGTITADDDVDMTTNDNESSSIRLSNDGTITANDDVDMTANDNETPEPIRALLRRQYERNVLWSMSGYGKYLTAKKVMVGSFAVCTSVQTAVLTSAHKNGVGSGPNYSMFVKMMVQESLGEDTIFFDLFPGTHHCKALDNKRVPLHLARQGAACAADIVDLGLEVIAFGGHAQDALRKAAKQKNASIEITNAPHPCQTSAYKSTNDPAIGFAKQYDILFRSDVGSFEGFVYWYGLNSDSADFCPGGVLSVNFCKRHLEKVNGEPCENVHINVSSFCLGLGIQNDVQAATHLRKNGYGHHLVLSRTLLYIIHISVKGGSCGGLNDHRVVAAQTELDILREAPEQDLDAIEAAMIKLDYAIKLRNITSEGKSKGGKKGGSCGGDNDYRVKNAQEAVDELLDASVTDEVAIKAAMIKLDYAIKLRNITSEGKSKGGSKGGPCGGVNDPRVKDAQAVVEELLDASVTDEVAIKAAMERLRVAIAKRDHTFKLKSEGRLGRVAATKPLLVLQLVSALGTEREFQFTPRKSQCKNDILAVLVNEKSVKKFNDTSKGWMRAWVEAAEASTEKSLTFKAVDSRKLERLRADNEDFEWKLSIHSTEDTIPPNAVPVEMEDRAVDKALRVKNRESQRQVRQRQSQDTTIQDEERMSGQHVIDKF